jgi:CNT family concentrative nucleoside transporter
VDTPATSSDETCEPHNEDNAKGITESLVVGANAGAKLAVGVAVTLIAFIGLLGIARGVCGHFTGNPHFIENILTGVFYPFAWLTGVPPNDVPAVAKMLGERLILTEIPSYIALGKFAAAGGSERTVLITSYSLCGFAHIGSMAIFVGGIGALAPKKMRLLSRLGPKALLGATLVTLMTGAVAGIFYFGQKGLIQ